MTNLQRNIHPLALKNLRHLLDYNDRDWSKLMNNWKGQGFYDSEPKKGEHTENKPDMENMHAPTKSSSTVAMNENDNFNAANT